MFRRMGTVGLTLLTITLLGGGLGYALAQDGDASVEVVKVAPMGAPGGTEPRSAGVQAKAADSAVANASATCAAQSQALQSAKREKDIIRATCLDDKLSQCNANLQSMKRRQAALQEAITAGDPGKSKHELTVIAVLTRKIKGLAQAANQCVGQDLFDSGDTEVKGEVDLFAPDQDPALIPTQPVWPIPYIPPPVSGVN